MVENPIDAAATNTPSEGISLTVIDTWKVKLPSVYIALPQEFINHVGGVVIAWGLFEKAFEDFLTAMIAETGNTYGGWQFFSLEQKRGIFEREMKQCFSACTDILFRLSTLMADTKPLQVKRNALVHGQIVLKIDSMVPSLIVTSRKKGQETAETFTKDGIDDLYYQIIHAAGRMNLFLFPEDVQFLPPLSLSDRSRLLTVLSRNPTPRSKLSMISHLHRPSFE
jgi:hypothetical protein